MACSWMRCECITLHYCNWSTDQWCLHLIMSHNDSLYQYFLICKRARYCVFKCPFIDVLISYQPLDRINRHLELVSLEVFVCIWDVVISQFGRGKVKWLKVCVSRVPLNQRREQRNVRLPVQNLPLLFLLLLESPSVSFPFHSRDYSPVMLRPLLFLLGSSLSVAAYDDLLASQSNIVIFLLSFASIWHFSLFIYLSFTGQILLPLASAAYADDPTPCLNRQLPGSQVENPR